MKKMHKLTGVFGLLFVLVLVPVIIISEAPVTAKSDADIIEDAIEDILGPNVATVYSPDGKGYLQYLGSPDKYILHVEGTGYEMGYQHGYLQAEEVQYMTSDYLFKQVLLAFCGVSLEESYEMLEEALTGTTIGIVLAFLLGQNYIDQIFALYEDILDIAVVFIKDVVANNIEHVPQTFLDEMQGVADGATAAGYSTSLESVLMLNMGFDALLSFLYPIIVPFMALEQWMSWHSCDGFVAYDHATSNGNTIMGRNWMFTDIVTADHSMLIEYEPDNGYKFISVGVPGMIGITSGMNTAGIGIGIDMVPAFDCAPGWFGMGGVLTTRYVMQFKGNRPDAAYWIGQTYPHGVSWLYLIGDGKGWNRGGDVVEVSGSWWAGRDHRYEVWWPWSPLYDMIEHKDDVVAVANSYGVPTMNFGAGGVILEDSVWRYQTVTQKVLDQYGSMTLASAKSIVDYLHPPNYDYYDPDPSGPIEGIRTVFDLTTLQLYTLYGYYDDPWVSYTLTP